ncbi:MAG: hypothetical protein U1C72_01365, partial [Candidatus Pacearchaeota archaeon]|nr:hypothetical protein [Candidatus Pacearchaeota archaeon]
MQLSYSFDGASWMLIGKVHGKNSSFSIPGITMASELKDVWFRLSGDPSVAGKKSVYLDALRMEIEFERLNGGTENLPAVLLQDSSITFASGRKDFLSNETPRFLIRDPQIELPQIESLVFEGRAEITKDRKGNLQRAVAFRKNSIEKGGGGSQSLIEKVKEKLKEILPKDVPPGQEKKQDEKDPGKGTPPESPGPPAEVPQPSPGNEGGQGAPLKDKEKKEKVNFLEFFRTGVAYAKSANATRITAVILDWRGQNTDIVPEITSSLQNGQKYFDIAIPTQGRSIQPGRYTLRVEIQTPSAVVTSQQDFTWGVLALNVNKSIYAPGEEAYVQIGVLDDAGHTICDAGLELALTSPTGSVSTFSTDKGTIEYSTECGPETVTNTPDYFAFYGIRSETGVYEMSLTAVTANGTRSVADRFEVRDSVAFEVERTGPTRIYPLELYPMTLSVVAHEVFEGTVEERVPSSFVVFQPRRSRGFTSVRDEGNEKVISWDVSLAAGDSIQLGYLFDAPDVSPAFYLLGPLKIGSFQEIRQWQVAGDIVSTGEVVPNGDITTGWAVVGGTSDGTCAGGGATHHCDRIDEARATPSTTDYVATGTAGSTGEVEEYDMTTLTLPSGATVTNITLWMYAQSSTNANGGTLDNVDMNIRIAGSLQTAVTKTPAFGTYQWHSASFSGSWTQANLDGFRSQFTRIRQGSGNPGNQDDDVRIATVYAVATYQYTLPPPSVTQEAYIFENDDGVDADGNTAHAAGNTALTNVKKGERLVLRTHLKNTTSGALDANVALFYDRNDGIWTKVKELQAAITAAGNCTDTNYDCTTVDSTGDVGDYTSIAIDQKGNPWVSYWDFTNSSLKVASYVGQGGNCFSGAWNCETIETGTPNPGVGQYTSIAFAPDGKAWISYLYSDTTDLRVATYVGSGGNCDLSTAWNCTAVDGTATTTGLFTSIAFSP